MDFKLEKKDLPARICLLHGSLSAFHLIHNRWKGPSPLDAMSGGIEKEFPRLIRSTLLMQSHVIWAQSAVCTRWTKSVSAQRLLLVKAASTTKIENINNPLIRFTKSSRISVFPESILACFDHLPPHLGSTRSIHLPVSDILPRALPRQWQQYRL